MKPYIRIKVNNNSLIRTNIKNFQRRDGCAAQTKLRINISYQTAICRCVVNV